ncbi:MAG: carboxypeptidase-like regulatory domain-containing protein [Eubacteriales bacterium]|nr:carboxypeptidase-like regulatory domain-containing protein [Eubacteriales bacterium]
MQGVVIDEKGGAVEAVIIRIIKAQESEEVNAEAVTYTKTDENGRFFIRNLEPEEEYIIEIHLNESGHNGANLIKPNHDLRNKLYQISNNTWW